MRLVKDGGEVIYSTCSLSKSQNEDVVQKAVSNLNGEGFAVTLANLTKELDNFEKLTELGFAESELKGTIRVLPSISCCGGMYIAKLIKTKFEL